MLVRLVWNTPEGSVQPSAVQGLESSVARALCSVTPSSQSSDVQTSPSEAPPPMLVKLVCNTPEGSVQPSAVQGLLSSVARALCSVTPLLQSSEVQTRPSEAPPPMLVRLVWNTPEGS